MKKPVLTSVKNFPQKTFAVLAIVALVAFLLTLKPVAEAVKKAAEAVGIKNFPPLDVFRNVANNIKEVAIGLLIFVVTTIVAAIAVKFGLIAVGIGLAGYGVYRIWQTFSKGVTQNTLPEPTPQGPSNTNPASPSVPPATGPVVLPPKK
jgi:hypothetical protein